MSNPKPFPLRIDAFAITCHGLLALYAAFLIWHATAVAGGADSAGYLTSARMITEGRLTIPARTIPELPLTEDTVWTYTPLGMVARGPDWILRPTYPVGLPIHFAASSSVLGWTWGPILVNALGAVVAILLTYASARELGAGRLTAAVGASALAVSPVLVFTSIQPLSDTLATTWSTAAFYCALRALRATSAGRASLSAEGSGPSHGPRSAAQSKRATRVLWSAACGLTLAVAVIVRPTNALILPALVLVLWNWRNLMAAFCGGLPGALFLGWYQATLYGSPLRTGYGDVGSQFSCAWIERSLAHYLTAMPVAMPIGIFALILSPWLPWSRLRRQTVALVIWFFAFAAFFATYTCTYESLWYLRFVLPAFPALSMAAAVALERLSAGPKFGSMPGIHRVAAAVIVAGALAIGHGALKRFNTYGTADLQRPYEELSRWARDNLPADAVIATLHASCSLYFYSEFAVIRSDLIGAENFAALRERLRASGRPAYALLHQYDDEPRRQALIPGDWQEIHRVDAFALWQLKHAP